MSDLLLTFNIGSSTLKVGAYLLRDPASPVFCLSVELSSGLTHIQGSPPEECLSFAPHQNVEDIAAIIVSNTHDRRSRVAACVHRIVHGGKKFHQPQWIDAGVLRDLGELEVLCPLHQPPALEIIHHLRKLWPELPHIVVFDTAFHHEQPELARTYALPATLRESGVEAYGFHGISCQHVMRELQEHQPALAVGRVLIAHLGQGSSMTAVFGGKSVACSMGFSTLNGLPMATRCGQLDAGIVLYLLELGWSKSRLTDLLYHRSGLLGLSGTSGDMRELLSSKSDMANFAVEYFCYRAAREVGSLAAALEGLDGLVFTGGIGENQPLIRKKITERLGWLGGKIDEEANILGKQVISSPSSRFNILIIPADEEQELSLLSQNLLRAALPS